MMFDKSKKFEYQYADKFQPVLSVNNTGIHSKEYSTETQMSIYFKCNGEKNTVGVLSVNAYSNDKWLPSVVKQLKLIANL